MKGSSEKPVPVDKKCRTCKKKKLLSEFPVDESTYDRRSTVCKTCESDKPVYGACCQYHFEEMMIANTYNQLELPVQVIETLQYNKAEIPRELLEKMFRIVHKSGVRCRFDSCDYDRKS
jgi:hypothetical protein